MRTSEWKVTRRLTVTDSPRLSLEIKLAFAVRSLSARQEVIPDGANTGVIAGLRL